MEFLLFMEVQILIGTSDIGNLGFLVFLGVQIIIGTLDIGNLGCLLSIFGRSN